jgi:hypothetical protein
MTAEEGRLASKKGPRAGLTLALHLVVNNITLAKSHLRTLPTADRKSLVLLDRLTGRGLPRIGTVSNKRKADSVELSSSVAPLEPSEHAMIEAAIQLDFISLEQAETLVKKGKTLGEWLAEQEKGEPRKEKKGKPATGEVIQEMLDALGVFALVLFNIVVVVGFGWIVVRTLRSL